MAQLKATTINGNLTVTGTSSVKDIKVGSGSQLSYYDKNCIIGCGGKKVEVLPRNYYVKDSSSQATTFPMETKSYELKIMARSWYKNMPAVGFAPANGTQSVTTLTLKLIPSTGSAISLGTISNTFTYRNTRWFPDMSSTPTSKTVTLNKGVSYYISYTSNQTDSGVSDVTGSVELTSSSNSVILGCSQSAYAGQTAINCPPDNGYDILIGAGDRLYASIASSTSTSWSVTSDARDKTDFRKIDDSLKFINSLKPVRFLNNSREKYIFNGEFDEDMYKKALLKGNRRQVGFIAQEVYETMKDIYSDDNYANIVDYNNYHEEKEKHELDRYMMCYTAFIPFLTGAIQELSSKLDEATNKINELENTISEMKNTQQPLNS